MSSDKDRKIEGSLFVHGNIYLTGEINQGELTSSSNSRKAVAAVTQVLALNPPDGSTSVGTATPGTVTMLAPQGFYDSIRLKWTKQVDLRWLDHYEIQVSSDNSSWYSLREDGVDWKGTLNAVTTTVEATYRHDNIPFAGTAGNPTAVTLYYRVRQVTTAGVIGAWCAGSTGMASPIQGDDKIAAGSIVGGNIAGTTITGDNIAANTITADKIDVVSLFAEEITVPSGGRQRWYDGQGVQRRCIELQDGRLSFIDAPDTSPPSDEVLRGVFGRLGVGPAVLMDGDFEANIESPWSVETPINIGSNNFFTAIIQRANGDIHVAYNKSDFSLAEIVKISGIWGSEIVIDSTPQSNLPTYSESSSGMLEIAYLEAGTGYLVERVLSGSTWGGKVYINSFSTGYPSFVQANNKETTIAYKRNGDGYLAERHKINGVWGVESDISGTSFQWVDYILLSDGERRVAYQRASDYALVERVNTYGTWGEETLISTLTGFYGYQFMHYTQLVDDVVKIMYTRSSDLYAVEKTLTGDVWGSTEILNALNSSKIQTIQSSGGDRTIFYASATYQLVSRTLRRYARVGAGIIEEGGDNTVGHWELYGNGHLHCWLAEDPASITATIFAAGTYCSEVKNFTFPKSFKTGTVPMVIPTGAFTSTTIYAWWGGNNIANTTNCGIRLWGDNGSVGYPGYDAWGIAPDY